MKNWWQTNSINSLVRLVKEQSTNIKTLAKECNYALAQHSFVPRSFPLTQQFSFRPMEQCEIEKIILSMPTGKAPGADKTPLRVIKDCLPIVLPSLTSIINTCFMTETFPSLWKMAEVTPILKNGDHEKANNNRPISLLPILSKICEKAALNQFLPYLVSNDRLTTKQSGNKRFHSTETSLIHTTDFILNAMDKKKITAIVLLDMSKAFDSINHGILLNKLQDIGASIQLYNGSTVICLIVHKLYVFTQPFRTRYQW